MSQHLKLITVLLLFLLCALTAMLVVHSRHQTDFTQLKRDLLELRNSLAFEPYLNCGRLRAPDRFAAALEKVRIDCRLQNPPPAGPPQHALKAVLTHADAFCAAYDRLFKAWDSTAWSHAQASQMFFYSVIDRAVQSLEHEEGR